MTFATAAVAGVVVHLDAPATRRLVATQANGILKKELQGDVQIQRIGSLGLRGVDGVSVRVKDPTGLQVLAVDGARVRIRALSIARSFLFGKGDIVIGVDDVSIANVDAAIDGDPQGNLRIANAFSSRTPPSPSDPNARGVRVDAPAVALGHAWIHGQAPGAPPVDAELSDLAANAHYDAKLTRADLERVDLLTRGLPRAVNPRGRIGAHLSMPSATGQSMGVSATFDGAVAGIPTTAQGSMDGQKIDAVLDGHDDSGSGVRATFGEVAIRDEVTLHAQAHGELPRIDGKAHIGFGRGSVDADGKVDLSDGTKAEAKVAVRHVDAHAIVASAPPSDAGLDAHGNLTIAKSGAMSGTFAVRTVPGSFDGLTLPILEFHGNVAKDTVHAVGTITDPRATADFTADLQNVGGQSIASGRIDADVPDFAKLPKVGASMKGRATATAEGHANLSNKTFDAKAHVDAASVAYDTQTVDNLTVLATSQGSFDHPVVDVGVHAGGVVAGGNPIGSADFRGSVAPGGITVIEGAHIDTVRSGHTVSVTARRIEVGGGRATVDGAVVQGIGQPVHADLLQGPGELRVRVDAPDVDLGLVALLAGKPNVVRNGHLAMKGDVDLRTEGATGNVHADIRDFSASSVDGASMNLDATFEGRKLGVTMNAELADAGRFELATKDLVIGGNPSSLGSWKHAHGKAKFDVNVDMAKVMSVVPKEQRDQLPLSELRGQLVVAGNVRRDSGDVPPELTVHAHTRGLVVAGKAATPDASHGVKQGVSVSGVQPWRSEGVDGSFDARVDATSGQAELAFHVVDRRGTLVALDAKSDIPYQQILGDPSRATALIEGSPLSVKLVVPKRALADMPQLAGTKSMPGTVEAELSITGTALDPRASFVAHARGVRSPQLPVGMASDADVDLTYDGQKGDLVAKLGTEKHEALVMTAHADVKAKDLLEGTPGKELAWGGSAKVTLASFPLQAINAVADRRIKGHISGEATLDDLHKDAKLHAQLGVDQLKIGRAQYSKGTIAVDARDGKVDARVRLEQTDGYADLHATTGLDWGADLAPSLDPNANLEATLDAKAFRAAAIQPFVQSQLNELDGRIDANATVKIGPGFKDPTMLGKVDFHDGTVQLATLGEEFKDARATVTFNPGGVIKIDNVLLRATDGEMTADAVVKTRGLGLDTATANVHIPKRKALDFSMEGQPIGAISGDVKLAATGSPDGKNLDVKVQVPTLNVALPQKLKSGLQSLDDPPQNIRIGVFVGPKTFVKLPLDKDDLDPPAPTTGGMVTTIDVKLGEVTVIQGNQASVTLGGNPHIRIADTTQLTGQIELVRGKVDVQGKEFVIEKGTITFQPNDTSNPIIVATAEWTADDGSKIFADFVGPVKTGKVNLRSEPPRPKNEVLAMILFGTADGANASPQAGAGAPDGTTRAATSVGGGYAAQGLTEAMDDLTGVKATARIDTSRSTNPAPEIEVQLARRVALAFEHVLGTPPISEPDTNLAIIDFRIRKNWSLETTFGDRGKVAADAIWQKRY